MTAPEVRPGRSPGAILAGLIVILLLCAGVIVWDQMRGPPGVALPAPANTNTAPAPSPLPAPSGSNDGFGELK